MKGKAKELFEQWYLEWASEQYGIISQFYEIPKAFQWGVYQDFADSLGYDMSTSKHKEDFFYLITDKTIDIWVDEFEFKTRQEARNAAIEKLNEIINQNK